MGIRKNNTIKSGLKKHDWLRIVGQPMMVIGHCAQMAGYGGEPAKIATVAGAIMMTGWVVLEVGDFIEKRRKTARRVGFAA